MPLVTSKPNRNSVLQAAPTAELKQPLETVKVSNIQQPIIDTAWVDKSHLLTHVEGASWIVDYYSQVLTQDSNLSGLQSSVDNPYQTYTLVKGLELKVTTVLSTDQDDSTKAMRVMGTSTIYPFLIPNEGDMFIADIGQNRFGLFRVVSTTKKSIFKEATYEISYNLDTDDPVKINELFTRAIDTKYFHKDFLLHGQSPLLIKSEAEALIQLEKDYKIIFDRYIKQYFSQEFKTLMLPGQEYKIYDPYLVGYMLNRFTSEDNLTMLHLRKLNLDDDPVSKADSFWTMLKLRDIGILNTSFKRFGLVPAKAFTRNPVYQGIAYSGFDHVIYPIDPAITVDGEHINNLKPVIDFGLNNSPDATIANSTIVRALNLRNLDDSVNYIYPVTEDDYYVLTENFYSDTESTSELEEMVLQYIRKEPIDIAQLSDISKLYHKWGTLERFYYVPVLLTLIHSTIRGF